MSLGAEYPHSVTTEWAGLKYMLGNERDFELEMLMCVEFLAHGYSCRGMIFFVPQVTPEKPIYKEDRYMEID